jgi:succinate-acetate transporter protein
LEPVANPLAFFYGGLAQAIAGIFEFKAPNAFGATAFLPMKVNIKK